MPARPRMILRSHPGRAAALAIAVLLASGAVVAALSGGPDGSGQRQKSLSSNALRPVAGGGAGSSDTAGYGGGGAPTAPVGGGRAPRPGRAAGPPPHAEGPGGAPPAPPPGPAGRGGAAGAAAP